MVVKRAQFFKQYSPFSRQLVFLDETWIFSKRGQVRTRQDESVNSVRKPSGYDIQKFIVCTLVIVEGFVENPSLIFATKSKFADYHGDMNAAIFKK